MRLPEQVTVGGDGRLLRFVRKYLSRLIVEGGTGDEQVEALTTGPAAPSTTS